MNVGHTLKEKYIMDQPNRTNKHFWDFLPRKRDGRIHPKPYDSTSKVTTASKPEDRKPEGSPGQHYCH